MTSWAEFEKVEPQFAATVRERFGMYKHHVLGTVRRDGAPRLSGLEADFRFEQMWLGMMPGSMKARDLLRDPRFSIFANPGEGAEMTHGDVRVSGRAIEVVDDAVKGRYAAETMAPEPFHLFRVELDEVSRIGVEGEEIVIRVWRPGGPVRTIRRGNDSAPAREEG
ncbi:pyridoxamine 5'-phosphate oxidase family protein [Embleya scabrispora]|uniref:pyridoxamine 5'-phosphate oxidase family protein n=1 Tax=Embleya scabrispora TaxID=159449 RepID=UPI0003734082|nr:pyridoxamine 5'-phosphate oxidase family protein [Embleya scabrispora]MYS82363.1 pyridoxamine 5'-phosphate oxidase family protein [Streptomyces sp. SID5474]